MKTLLLIATLCFTAVSAFSQGRNVVLGQNNGLPSYFVGSLPKNTTSVFEKLKIEVFGGNWTNTNLGECVYYISSRGGIKVNKEVRGGSVSKFALKIYDTGTAYDFVIQVTDDWPAFFVRSWKIGGNNAPAEVEINSFDPMGKIDITGEVQVTTVFSTDNNGNTKLVNVAADLVSGKNILPVHYASYEFGENGNPVPFQGTADAAAISTEYSLDGTRSLKVTGASGDEYAYLSGGGNLYDIPVQPSTKYIFSAYARTASGVLNGQVYVKTNPGATFFGSTQTQVSESWTRLSVAFTTGASVQELVIRVDVDGTGTLYFDQLMLEQVPASQSNPSAWTPPMSIEGLAIYNNNLIISPGNVGIGTTTPDAKLTVKGTIHTQEVKVDLNGAVAPDYVFADDYSLPELSQTHAFIKTNKHLPGIPSAAEMEEEGINLKEMNLKLLEKVEELTLYLIEHERRNTALHEKVQRLEVRLDSLETKK